MSRGDLSEVKWRLLKVLLPVEREPGKRGRGRPPEDNRTKTIRYSKRLYRERNCIERVLGHLKINRAIATRYDQLADSFLAMLFIASARYWIKFVHAA